MRQHWCCQRDVGFFRGRLEVGHIATIERSQCGFIQMIVAHLIEQLDKGRVGLTIDVLEFDRNIFRLFEGLAAKEIRRFIIAAQRLPIVLLDDGWQLVQVADHQQLDITERTIVAAKSSQSVVDSIQQVCSHHADLVDHQQFETANQI